MKNLIVLIAIMLCGWNATQVGAQSMVAFNGHWGKALKISSDFPTTTYHKVVSLAFLARQHGAYSSALQCEGRGFTLSFHDPGNTAVLGYGVGLQYASRFRQPLCERLGLYEEFRIGGVYYTKKYQALHNPLNTASGSKLSALVGLEFGIHYNVSRRMRVLSGVCIWHSSNGHVELPNTGINSIVAVAGINVLPNREKNTDSSHFTLPVTNEWRWSLAAVWGINEAGSTTRPVDGPKYTKKGLDFWVAYRSGIAHSWSVSLLAYHDQTYAVYNHLLEWDDPSLINSSALALLLGHEFIYERLSLAIQGGVNLYNPTLKRIVSETEGKTTGNVIKQYVPGRFLMRYFPLHPDRYKRTVYLQAGIKSNFGQADFLEIGIGIMNR